MPAIGSREHWLDPASYPPDWEARAVQAGLLIAPGASVLDIGCGPHMALRRHLPAGCAYTPADLRQWTEEVERIDIDAALFPQGEFDCIVLLGVIEYLARPGLAFRFARPCASAMVISYCHPLTDDPEPRRRMGWVNAYSVDELQSLSAAAGWRVERSETFGLTPNVVHQMIHVLSPV